VKATCEQDKNDRNRPVLVGAALGGPGGKTNRALLGDACATPGRLNPKELNPTPESQLGETRAEETERDYELPERRGKYRESRRKPKQLNLREKTRIAGFRGAFHRIRHGARTHR
jgi:hypothetical protein